jgi:hypothetical protein
MRRVRPRLTRYSVYWLYWCKSTNTDATFSWVISPPPLARYGSLREISVSICTFVPVKQVHRVPHARMRVSVYLLYLLYWYKVSDLAASSETVHKSTSTCGSIVFPARTGCQPTPRGSVYWLYWYKSTNTCGSIVFPARTGCQSTPRCSVYWLYWYKSTNTDANFAQITRIASDTVLRSAMSDYDVC